MCRAARGITAAYNKYRMKTTNNRIVARFLGAAACLAGLALSQQTAPPAASPAGSAGAPTPTAGRGGLPFDYADNEGWVSLFDGQSLNGWDGDPRFWSVKDGAIYVQATCEKPTGTIYL